MSSQESPRNHLSVQGRGTSLVPGSFDSILEDGEKQNSPFGDDVPGPFRANISELRYLARQAMAIYNQTFDNLAANPKGKMPDAVEKLCDLALNVSHVADRAATQWTRLSNILDQTTRPATRARDIDYLQFFVVVSKIADLYN
jgi:hypothetical protein